MMNSSILSLGEYERYRQLCHGVKDGSERAISDAAVLLSALTPSDSTLVPLPSHHGKATYMLDIALQIAKLKGCTVDPCIVSGERAKLYDIKMAGGQINLNFRLTHTPRGNIYLLDNCVDTGMTYRAASRLLGLVPIITIAKTQERYHK